jgi:hypothetical protein
MKVGSDAIPDTAGGEGGHGAAKPHDVIHIHRSYQGKSNLIGPSHVNSRFCFVSSWRIAILPAWNARD